MDSDSYEIAEKSLKKVKHLKIICVWEKWEHILYQCKLKFQSPHIFYALF